MYLTMFKFTDFELGEFCHNPLPKFHLPASTGKFYRTETEGTVSQFSSVAQSCPTLYDPMNRSTPGLPVHHQLPESIQTHVHCVSDGIQPSHPLLFPSSPAPFPASGSFQMSQLSVSGGQSIGDSASASVLPMNTQETDL